MQLFKQSKAIQLVAPGPIAGTERVILAGTRALKDMGIDIPIWVIKETRVPHVADAFLDAAKELNLTTRTLLCHSRFDWKLKNQLKKYLIHEKINLLHAHGIKATVYAQFVPKSVTTIATFHGTTGHTLMVKIYEMLEMRGMKKANKVVAVSSVIKDMLKNKGIPENKIAIIENPLSFKINPINKFPNNETIQLLYVGRLSPEKGLEFLLKAISEIEFPLKLTILGDGVQRDYLVRLSSELNIHTKVDFVGFQSDVASFMHKAHTLVLPSLREGMPMTLIEACCLGLPVIASNVGAISQLVTDHKNGILVTPGKSESLIQAIKGLKSNIELFELNAIEMSGQFRERFSATSWAQNTLEVYNNVLSQE
jgi:glycosyltransferase involved in cell wall biosynthesis